ncbi:glycerophosphodiester phosphodiesterase [Candidatus Microgenomates bacterium]|nr:glycerophosphodiester phosphodiesterase [Candidatus Microgenomates bacterium]
MLLIAHRGDKTNYPENTIEAFRSALEKGSGGIEFDVQVENGEPIIVHDYIRNNSQPYPRLSQVLEEFGSRTHLEIEIKSFKVEEFKVISKTVKNFSPKDMEITSSIHPLIPHIRETFPKTYIGEIFPDKLFENWMTEEFLEMFFEGYLKLTGANVIHLPSFLFQASVIQYLKNRGYLLHHHLSTDEQGEYNKLINLEIDFATFDNINLLEKIEIR